MVHNKPFLVLFSPPEIRLICEYVIVTDELKSNAEFIKPKPSAEGMGTLSITLAILLAGAQVLLVSHEQIRDKNAKASAATNQ